MSRVLSVIARLTVTSGLFGALVMSVISNMEEIFVVKRPKIEDVKQLTGEALIAYRAAGRLGVWDKLTAHQLYVNGIISGMMYVCTGSTQAAEVLKGLIVEVKRHEENEQTSGASDS